MRGNEYQILAGRTINPALYDYEMEMHALHGMVGEVGELNSLYQKAFQGHEKPAASGPGVYDQSGNLVSG